MTRARDVANLIGSGNYSSTTFTATAGQTAFTIAHTQGFIQVFMNGLLLDETVDYTSNGSAVTLTSGAAAGDEIEVVAYNTFSVGDALNQAAADTRYVNTTGDTMTGTLNVNGGNFYLAPDNAAAHRYMYLNTATSNDGHIILQRALSNKHQLTTKPDNSFNIYGYDASADVFNIDSSGRMTTPKQPSFWAYMSQSNPTITGLNVKIPYSATRWNVGSHFDTTNSRFVAPIAGKYCFQVNHNVYGLSDDQYFRTRVYVNGSSWQILGYMRARGSGDHTTNDSFLLDMSANDYVEIYTNSADTSYHLSASAGWNSFSGFLIG